MPISFKVARRSLVDNCSGTVSVVPSQSHGWTVWMMTTVLENFDGHGHPDIPARPVKVSPVPDIELHRHEQHQTNKLSVLVIGAGQQGLSLAARLQALGVDYLLLEQGESVGRTWTNRYDSAKLHTVREMNNLPWGRTWSSDDPIFISAKRVAEGFQQWTKKHDINVWVSSRRTSCSPHDNGWAVQVQRENSLTYSFFVEHLALGMGFIAPSPTTLEIPGRQLYQGTALHSSEYKNSRDWSGKTAVIVGSGTSAFDIAEDMVGAVVSSITMIQRNKTAIFPNQVGKPAKKVRLIHEPLLSRHSNRSNTALLNELIPTAVADRAVFAMPEEIAMELVSAGYRTFNADHPEFLDALEKTGFRVDRESKLNDLILTRSGGYYPDVGGIDHVTAGRVKILSGIPIERFTTCGIRLRDGTLLEADVVIFATGFEHDLRRMATPTIGKTTADKLGDFWGIDEAGDVRGLMTQHSRSATSPWHDVQLNVQARGIWPLKGSMCQARSYSQFVALQIQAEKLGCPLRPPGVL